MDLQRLEASLKLHEGFKGKPYKDTEGYTTIGYGRCLDTDPLTPAEGQLLLDNDIAAKAGQATRLVANFDTLGDVRQNVLAEMTFNLGFAGVSKFHDMRTYIEANHFPQAATAMLNSKWAVEVKGRAEELAHMMETGEWV